MNTLIAVFGEIVFGLAGQGPGRSANVFGLITSVVISVVAIVVTIAAAKVCLRFLRRKMTAMDEESGSSQWTLGQLRRLLKSGQITEVEFKRMKKKAVAPGGRGGHETKSRKYR
jgi:uncharacterized membrane protein